MRLAAAISCLVLLLLPAAAAPGDTAAYLAARDRYIAQFKALPPKDDPSDTREARALADLDRRLEAIIPPWQAAGSPRAIRTNISILHQDLGFGTLDGLAYGIEGTEVIVTTGALLHRWLADHNNTGSASWDVPQSVDAAAHSSQFWTFAYGDDNGWLLFGDVPVVFSGGTGTAQLAVDTDSGVPDAGPKYLLVTVLRNDRIFVARQKLRTTIAPQPLCNRARAFQPCYAQYLRGLPQWDAIRNQAQALADLLH